MSRSTSSRRARGFTLIEVTIAITLIGFLAVSLLFAMRIGFTAMQKSNDRLMHNRRVNGVERILEQQIAAMLPVTARCSAGDPQGKGEKVLFFEGEAVSMRFVSNYSLQEGGRGMPKILEFQTVPGNEGVGVRLVVNESLYSGPLSVGGYCLGRVPEDEGPPSLQFAPIAVGPGSFVLADKLAVSRFAYLEKADGDKPARWVDHWKKPLLPEAIRLNLVPLNPDAASVQLLPLTVPVHITRDPLMPYQE
jgi:prepilin-type N-terminal cleavage/methylation domain-containing protein